MADAQAIRECNLFNAIENLPYGYAVIADAAYPATKHLLPMYSGVDQLNSGYNNCNYIASKCHIRIEMAFRKMKNKWRILDRPLVGYENSLRFLHACHLQAAQLLHQRVSIKDGD